MRPIPPRARPIGLCAVALVIEGWREEEPVDNAIADALGQVAAFAIQVHSQVHRMQDAEYFYKA